MKQQSQGNQRLYAITSRLACSSTSRASALVYERTLIFGFAENFTDLTELTRENVDVNDDAQRRGKGLRHAYERLPYEILWAHSLKGGEAMVAAQDGYERFLGQKLERQ